MTNDGRRETLEERSERFNRWKSAQSVYDEVISVLLRLTFYKPGKGQSITYKKITYNHKKLWLEMSFENIAIKRVNRNVMNKKNLNDKFLFCNKDLLTKILLIIW